MTLDDLERCPVADNTPGGVLIEVSRADVARLIVEIERLRVLVKDAEFSNYHQAVDSGFCPWCDGDSRGGHHIKSATCSTTCPAFTPDGAVRGGETHVI